MKPRKLEDLRENMKEKDRGIIHLLNERAQISVQIGKVKGEGGIDDATIALRKQGFTAICRN